MNPEKLAAMIKQKSSDPEVDAEAVERIREVRFLMLEAYLESFIRANNIPGIIKATERASGLKPTQKPPSRTSGIGRASISGAIVNAALIHKVSQDWDLSGENTVGLRFTLTATHTNSAIGQREDVTFEVSRGNFFRKYIDTKSLDNMEAVSTIIGEAFKAKAPSYPGGGYRHNDWLYDGDGGGDD